MLPHEFADFFIQFGTGLCFLLALLEISKKEKSIAIGNLFFIGFFLGLIQLRLGFYSTKLILKYPNLTFSFVPSILAIGPMVLKLGVTVTDFTSDKKVLLRLHLIPAWIALFLDTAFVLLNPEQKISIVEQGLFTKSITPYKLLYIFAMLHILTYFGYMVHMFLRITKQYEINYTSFVWIILNVPIAGVLFISIGFLNQIDSIYKLGVCILTITIILIYVFNTKYPRFFISLQNDIKQKKYETTLLTEVNVDVVCKRLDELMEENKIYRDEELRLNSLAEELSLTPHQLSRILNETYKKNFNEFINGYRIKEAEQILLSDPKRSILSIAYEVGFNSKGTFNSHFLKITGLRPSEYREKNK
ncbi:MAG TPA: helix-turn-helix domain-containing protein [Leptospiraceae bacterium]|nr:helix-turn-helix domain-containing protein [Leptospiraceae bacterium]HMW03571.1 helix-turn-helix domain-containing protein [Leptospiraceae bacterium]HMX32312.1 helix-turn-helix domain-containing protein [Leptospiraceae bacterium]HMY29508.1 helix-turn-helix domain-containing protein [Leptospiraceae bacterium]HMZ63571.1 helix-turn-helix domain-containing protein [Leptospiraceae bacterium]